MSNIPADSKYRFYMKKGAPEEQKGLYMLLHERKQIPIERIVEFIDEWDAEHGSRCGKRQGWSKRDTMQSITSNQGMEQLLAIVTKHTGIVFKKNPVSKEERRGKDYDDWWQERNLDGSFAYSGVTDDF
jgi:hypothetical protein